MALAAQDYDDSAAGAVRDRSGGIAESRALPRRLAGALDRSGSALAGLPEGIPVAVGTGDDFSSALGAGLTAPGRLINVLGTAEVVGALHPTPVIDRASLVETHAFPGRALLYRESRLAVGRRAGLVPRTSSGLPISPAWIAEAASRRRPVPMASVFIPALSGAMAPEWIASARGVFYGMTPSHGRGHLARARSRRHCFRDARCSWNVMQSLGLGVEAIRAVGGGAKSALWTQIRADVTGLPVEIPRHVDTSPIGAAMLASVAAGLAPNLARSAEALDRRTHSRPARSGAQGGL